MQRVCGDFAYDLLASGSSLSTVRQHIQRRYLLDVSDRILLAFRSFRERSAGHHVSLADLEHRFWPTLYFNVVSSDQQLYFSGHKLCRYVGSAVEEDMQSLRLELHTESGLAEDC